MAQLYKIPSYQSIFDALVTVKVPLDNIVSVLNESDLDFDSELTGEEISYELTQVSVPKGGQVATFATPTTSTYITNSTQNLYDVCLMTVGDLNKIVQLVYDNTIFDNINDIPDGVKTVIYNNSDITDSGFKIALKRAKINITTGGFAPPVMNDGFMLLETGFFLLQEDESKIEL